MNISMRVNKVEEPKKEGYVAHYKEMLTIIARIK